MQIIKTFTALLMRLFLWDVVLSLGDLLQTFQCSVLEFSILECGSRKPPQNMGLQLPSDTESHLGTTEATLSQNAIFGTVTFILFSGTD
jgi:hypothetical protein